MVKYTQFQAEPLRGAALKGLFERDIDHLLVEELQCSPLFFNWFLSHIADHPLQDIRCSRHRIERSESRSGVPGETDISLTLLDDKGNPLGKVLVENKLSAPFTCEQPRHYKDAVRHLSRDAVVAAAVLVAPQKRLAAVNEDDLRCFDGTISYEAIIEYFHKASESQTVNSELQARLGFKKYLLSQAIERAKSAPTVEIITEDDFWARFERPEVERRAAAEIIAWAKRLKLQLRFTLSKRRESGVVFSPMIRSPTGGERKSHIYVDSHGKVVFFLSRLQNRPPFTNREVLEDLYRQLKSLPGLESGKKGIGGMITVRLASLAAGGSGNELIKILEQIVRCP